MIEMDLYLRLAAGFYTRVCGDAFVDVSVAACR